MRVSMLCRVLVSHYPPSPCRKTRLADDQVQAFVALMPLVAHSLAASIQQHQLRHGLIAGVSSEVRDVPDEWCGASSIGGGAAGTNRSALASSSSSGSRGSGSSGSGSRGSGSRGSGGQWDLTVPPLPAEVGDTLTIVRRVVMRLVFALRHEYLQVQEVSAVLRALQVATGMLLQAVSDDAPAAMGVALWRELALHLLSVMSVCWVNPLLASGTALSVRLASVL